MAAPAALSTAQVAGAFISHYEALWRQADSSGSGSVSAVDAAAILKRSNVPDQTLRSIWTIADYQNRGSLDKQIRGYLVMFLLGGKLGFFIALRLVAAAQCGMQPTTNVLTMAATAPPHLDGTGSNITTSSAGGSSTANFVSASDLQKYDGIFQSLQPVDGRLGGDKVRPVLMNSKLPVSVLGQIWELADVNHDGFLRYEDFCVCMHLTYRALDGDPVPNVVSPQLRNQLSQIKKPRTSSLSSGPSVALLPSSTSSTPANASSSTSPTATATAWVVSSEDQRQYEILFRQLDADGKQCVSGEDVKSLFMSTGLPGNILAHIWSLCDMNGNGNLTAEQFMLAMHLAKQKRVSNIDPPTALTPAMIPPSMRTSAGNGNADGALAELTSQNEELSSLAKEIEQLHQEKDQCTEEVARKQNLLSSCRGDVQNLQLEVTQSQSLLQSLEKQKGEMAAKLQSNESELASGEAELTGLKEQVRNEESQIATLKSQLSSQQSSLQNQHEEIKKVRQEVSRLQTEEAELKASITGSRTTLNSLELELQAAKSEASQIRARISSLSEKGATASVVASPVSQSQFGSVLSSPTSNPSIPSADPFQSSGGDADPFISSSVADPFAKADPFGSSSADPFKTTTDGGAPDPFASTATSFAASSPDPFSSSAGSATKGKVSATLSSGTARATDFFGNPSVPSRASNTDLFKSSGNDLFSSSDPAKNSSDPFAGSGNTTSQDTSNLFGGGNGDVAATSAAFPASDPFASSSDASKAGASGFGFFPPPTAGSGKSPASDGSAVPTSSGGLFDDFGSAPSAFGGKTDLFKTDSTASAFGDSAASSRAPAGGSATNDPFAAFGSGDPFSSDKKKPAAATPSNASNGSNNLFSNDPFGAGGF